MDLLLNFQINCWSVSGWNLEWRYQGYHGWSCRYRGCLLYSLSSQINSSWLHYSFRWKFFDFLFEKSKTWFFLDKFSTAIQYQYLVYSDPNDYHLLSVFGMHSLPCEREEYFWILIWKVSDLFIWCLLCLLIKKVVKILQILMINICIRWSTTPANICVRIAFITILLGGCLVFWHWKARLISNLSIEKHELPFNSVEELLKSNYKVKEINEVLSNTFDLLTH